MKEVLKRDVKLGDLVFYYSGRQFIDKGQYGLVVGVDNIFNPDYGVVNCNNAYLVEILSEEQKRIVEDFKEKYRIYSYSQLSQNTLENEIGGIYIKSSQNICYMYLGKYKIVQENLKRLTPRDVLIIDNADKGGYCYVKINCTTAKSKELLENILLRFSSIKSDIELNNFLNSVILLANKLKYREDAGRYNVSARDTPIKLDSIIISSKPKKYYTMLYKVNIDENLLNKFTFDLIPREARYYPNIKWDNYKLVFKKVE